MSSLHHDRLPEGGAAPTGTVDATPAPTRPTGGTVEEKAESTVPPQRQGKARGAGARRTTAPTTRTRSRAAEVEAAAEAPTTGRRRPTPYKRSAVDLAAPAPVAVEQVVPEPDVEPAEVAAAGVAGRRGLLARRLPTGRPRLYLAAARVGALSVGGASVSGATEVATETAGQSVSVAEQLGIEASPATPQVDEDDTSRLREMVASRAERDADRTAAADAQAEADRIAQEEADRAAAEAARPKAVLPVEGGRLTSGFGARWGTLHAGIDLAAPMRTPEYAVMDGVVLEAGPASGYGLAVYIQHDNGDVTVYGHMDEILVTPGQVVRAGDTIALLGNRGQSTGPHLHFEVHVGGIDGERIDPLPWLRERGVQI
jgi:murein DD-endopeptidase MepM/ murein hydrolase activator NlpD